MFIVSHPTGNTFVRALLPVLKERSLLHAFWTTLAVDEGDLFVKLLPGGPKRQALRRAYPISRQELVRVPWREGTRLVAPKLGLRGLTQHETGWACVDAVYRDLDARVARDLQSAVGKGLKGVYCYEDGALETFKAARKLGLQTVYELPIAYWETSTRLLSEEAERWPEWEPTLVGTRDSDAKLARKTEELSLADVVVTPSQFVYDSLPESIRESKACVVSPFGSPQVPEFNGESLDDSAGPLRVLFAGSLTQRKGLADLFQAISLLKRRDVELIVLGKPVVSLEFYRRQMPTFVYESPRPHAEVLKLMRSCHLMALPSIVEGRALVQQEALANGLPILVTANAGGQDLIEEGRTGFLVPMRSPEKLAEKIDFLADNRSIIPEMRRHARKKAAEYTWERYGRNIVDAMLAHGK